jgi:hypothetical protein
MDGYGCRLLLDEFLLGIFVTSFLLIGSNEVVSAEVFDRAGCNRIHLGRSDQISQERMKS